MHNGNAGGRVYNIIGFASMGYCLVMMIVVSSIFNNSGADSWKIAGHIGKIINVQLIIFLCSIWLCLLFRITTMSINMKE